MATAVPAERDAVAEAFPGPVRERRLPGAVVHRVTGGPGLLAAGVGPAAGGAEPWPPESTQSSPQPRTSAAN
ncbi:hypothetical protein ACWDUG_23525, partial [Streptomyces cellulosae]